jgi:PleD family two-component response regulator
VALRELADRVDTVGDRQPQCDEVTEALLQLPHRVDTVADRQPYCDEYAESRL